MDSVCDSRVLLQDPSLMKAVENMAFFMMLNYFVIFLA